MNELNPDPLAEYRRTYTEAQIEKNQAKKLEPSMGILAQDRGKIAKAIYAAAEKGDSAELLKLVEPWFAHQVLNDYSGSHGKSTPLIAASFNGHIECVKILAAQPGIELNKGSYDNQRTALFLASSRCRVDIVELLCSLPDIDVNKKDAYDDTPYSTACSLSFTIHNKEKKQIQIRAILEKKGATKGGKRKRTYKKNPKKTKKGRSRKHK